MMLPSIYKYQQIIQRTVQTFLAFQADNTKVNISSLEFWVKV